MKKIILTVFGVLILLGVAVFSGVFYEDYGLIRGLRAKELLATTPEMVAGFKKAGGPINAQIAEIEADYEQKLSKLEMIRDKARNSFFKLPKDTRYSSKEGQVQKYLYLDAAYKIVILEHQKNLKVAILRNEQYLKGRQVRMENLFKEDFLANEVKFTNIVDFY